MSGDKRKLEFFGRLKETKPTVQRLPTYKTLSYRVSSNDKLLKQSRIRAIGDRLCYVVVVRECVTHLRVW